MTEPRSDEELQQARVTPLVPHNAPVTLVEYTDEWPRLFAREAERIRSLLGDEVRLLEHAGSTSVPGLAAKPIIDIVLAVADSADEDAYVTPLVAGGYLLKVREPDWFEHRVLKGPDTDINLHVFSEGASEIAAMLAFRDHLRADPADRALYLATKRALAARTWRHIQHYADAKSQVVRDIMTRARPRSVD
ncbi:GrpB family protein [Actinokineospora sp. G85]|uniref:GrpB family protein n=1 Tax=Actinokineospora sp. G85 TaxID=3406626 RepID=UPI003C78A6AC